MHHAVGGTRTRRAGLGAATRRVLHAGLGALTGGVLNARLGLHRCAGAVVVATFTFVDLAGRRMRGLHYRSAVHFEVLRQVGLTRHHLHRVLAIVETGERAALRFVRCYFHRLGDMGGGVLHRERCSLAAGVEQIHRDRACAIDARL